MLSILVLGCGLGLSIFTFTFSYLMSYKPLPQEGGDAIVRVCSGEMGSPCGNFKAFEFAQLRQDVESLEFLTVAEGGRGYIGIDDRIRRIFAIRTEPSMFALSDGVPILGRTLQESDMDAAAEPVAVIGYDVWQSFFDGDPNTIDRVVTYDERQVRIVGIMPDGYKFPSFAQLWTPISNSVLNPVSNDMVVVSAYARLRSGDDSHSASTELDSLMSRLRSLYPADPNKEFDSFFEQRIETANSAQVMSLPLSMMGATEGIVFMGVLNLLSTLVFLLVCINVGTLLLARVNERMRDISVRVALGAPRKRLLIQVMGESIFISVFGGLIGIFIAGAMMEVLRLFVTSISDLEILFWWDFSLDSSSYLMVAVFIAFTLLMVSAIPSWRVINGDFNAVMRDGTRGSLGLKASQFSRLLVVAAIALITLLLYAGVLVGGSLIRLQETVSGVDGDRMLSFPLEMSAESYDAANRLQFYQNLQLGLSQESSIDNALVYVPLGQAGIVTARDEGSLHSITLTEILGPLETFNASLLAGRSFNALDSTNQSTAALVTQSLADKLWPGQNPLQRRLLIPESLDVDGLVRERTVVGVVSNEPIAGLFSGSFSLSPSTDAVYLPVHSSPDSMAWGLVSHNGEADIATASIVSTARRLDTDLQVFVRDMDSQMSALFIMVDYGIAITLVIGCFAFLVAIAGIYGLTKNFVDLSHHEIGTRRALGATDKRIRITYLVAGSKQLVAGFLVANFIALPLLYITLAIFGSDYVDLQMLLILVIALSTLFLTVMLAIFHPLRQLLLLEPSDVLRYQ